MDRFFNLLTLLVAVAGVTTLVAHPNTAKVITAGGDAFDNSLAQAEGNTPKS